MKKLHFIMFLCTLLLMYGCFGSDDKNCQTHTDTKTPVIEKLVIRIPEDSIVTEAEEPISNTFIDNTRKQYTELYETIYMFTDMYIVGKAWLIGDENIVQLTSVGGFSEATVLTRNNIEKIEQASFDDFATVSIIDKTSQILSLMISSEDLLVILELLK